jgi:hypothetical protein
MLRFSGGTTRERRIERCCRGRFHGIGLRTEEILSKVVYAERAHPVEMISKVSLGGLLDLFLTVDEFDARYDFGEQFRTVEPAPVFLGFQAQFKDHGQCRDS